MSESAVTTVIYHRVNSANRNEYHNWQTKITNACKDFAGYQDTLIFKPGIVTHNDNEYVTVFRFANKESLQKWLDSEIRHELLHDAEKFTIGKIKIAFFTGLEHWFSQKNTPPRYKMTLVTFFTIWPLVHFVPLFIDKYINWGSLGNELLIVATITVIMSYIALPIASRLFSFWLKR